MLYALSCINVGVDIVCIYFPGVCNVKACKNRYGDLKSVSSAVSSAMKIACTSGFEIADTKYVAYFSFQIYILSRDIHLSLTLECNERT